DAEFLDKGAANRMGARAKLIRCGNSVIVGHHDGFRSGHLLDFPPVSGKEVTVIEDDGIDIDHDEIPRSYGTLTAGPRKDLLHDRHTHALCLPLGWLASGV